ncbi:WD40 repeat-like protein [Cylindrobasidium torrendii FP15055 ss-10]|uniref:WD40 repeat-like protein n=1 Tax=Cylindrobasidium torrendii FP15055 ss-10 TaxID=1314674 RepID=A0A0D7BHZ9_9AGAR|nr:WD40 repeat-like protein [Cylindrobasidium torrendii FP15055 ss-10]
MAASPAPRRRVSYVLPPTSSAVPRLAVPPRSMSENRLGRPGPLLIPEDTVSAPSQASLGTQHRLGISALALDSKSVLQGNDRPEGILYSGGRDGMVIGWDLGLGMRRKPIVPEQGDGLTVNRRRQWELMTGWADDAIEEEEGEDFTSDGDVLGDVTPFSSSLHAEATGKYASTWELDPSSSVENSRFRISGQMHMNWVNDIKLCNKNQTIVTASSDGTVTAWNPHSSDLQPWKVGAHTDFARCLADSTNWVASGSFDRTIKLWDISRTATQPVLELSPIDSCDKSSIYSIAADPLGKTIASGSPERVVRLWDPLSGKGINKLVGHTDTIRTILISEDARYLLTGSADASIKLWSLASQRCLHTFTHHADSVWSLFSSSSSLESFYSGDRAGWVCRVDVEGCSDVAEGECVVLCRDGSVEATPDINGGVNAIVALDDQLVWTASGANSNISSWQVPRRRSYRALALQKDYSSYSLERPLSPQHSPELHYNRLQPKKRRSADDTSLHALSVAEEEDHLYGIHYDSLIKLESPFPSAYPRQMDPEVATLYSSASIMSVRNMHPSSSMSQAVPEDTTQIAYHQREVASEATPLVKAPAFVLRGGSGLVRAIILNDRIHALSVDTRGEVAVWDLVRGTCRGSFDKPTVDKLLYGAKRRQSVGSNTSHFSADTIHSYSAREALEGVREAIEGEGVTASWSSVDTKAGVLSVHISDRCFEAEVYADEVGFQGRGYNEDSKLNVGKWVLRNLFLGFLREESRMHRRSHSQPDQYDPHSPLRYHIVRAFDMVPAIPISPSPVVPQAGLRTPLIPIQSLQMPPPPMSPSSSLPTPGIDATPMQHHRLRSQTLDSNKPPDDYFAVKRQNSITEGVESTTPGGGIMGRIKNFGKKPSARPMSEAIASTSVIEEPEGPTTPVPSKRSMDKGSIKEKTIEKPKTEVDAILVQPFNPPTSTDAPTHAFPAGMQVMISDEDVWGEWSVKYQGQPHVSFHDDREGRRRVVELERTLPLWLLEFLYLAKTPAAPPAMKISFVLLPWRDELPELINTSQSKLTANRLLRVRKLVTHVQEKLERISTQSRGTSIRGSLDESSGHGHISPSSSPSQFPSALHGPPGLRHEQQYEILCNDIVLPPDMSLAAVRQYVWKNTNELVMHYRGKV